MVTTVTKISKKKMMITGMKIKPKKVLQIATMIILI